MRQVGWKHDFINSKLNNKVWLVFESCHWIMLELIRFIHDPSEFRAIDIHWDVDFSFNLNFAVMLMPKDIIREGIVLSPWLELHHLYGTHCFQTWSQLRAIDTPYIDRGKLEDRGLHLYFHESIIEAFAFSFALVQEVM